MWSDLFEAPLTCIHTYVCTSVLLMKLFLVNLFLFYVPFRTCAIRKTTNYRSKQLRATYICSYKKISSLLTTRLFTRYKILGPILVCELLRKHFWWKFSKHSNLLKKFFQAEGALKSIISIIIETWKHSCRLSTFFYKLSKLLKTF